MFKAVSTAGLVVDDELKWSDLTPEEQAALIRLGYKPEFGAIIHGNLDLELQHADRRD